MSKVSASGKQVIKRRPRIVTIQKKVLVQLIENYFIRTTGRCTNVEFEAISSNAWVSFAEILNSWGPKKSSNEWKTCFYFMKNRIRKSVNIIQRCDSSVKDNLSALDYKIYSMSPSSGSVALEGMLNDDEHYGDCAGDQEEQNADNIGDYLLEDDSNIRQLDQDDGAGFCDDYGVTEDLSCGNYDDFVGGNNPDSSEFRDGEIAPRVLVVQSQEELEAYANTSMIVDEEESNHETDNVIDASTSHGIGANWGSDPNDYESDNPSSSSNLNVRFIATEREGNESSQHHQQNNVPQIATSKPNPRIPEIQKERLVQLIQNNFVKAFGRFTGSDGAHIKTKVWQTIAKELNTLGPQRTAEQWKATFNTIKTSAKSKLADNRNNDGSIVKPLTRLEEKILSIYGLDALDGNQQLGETGFEYRPTVPTARRVCTSTVTSGAFLSSNDENRHQYDELSLSNIDQFEYDELFDNHDMSCTELHGDNVTRNTEENEGNDVALLRRNDPDYEASVLDEILREIRDEGADTTESFQLQPSPGISESTSRPTAGAKSQNQMNVRNQVVDDVRLGSDLTVRDAPQLTGTSSAPQRTGTSSAPQRTGTSSAPQRTGTSTAAQRTITTATAQRTATSATTQRTITSAAAQRTITSAAAQRTITSAAAQRTVTSAAAQRTVTSAAVQRTVTSAAPQRQRTLAAPQRASNGDNSTHRIRMSSNTVSSNNNRSRGSSNGVHGVPRLHQRRREREQISEITSIHQFFNDNDEEDDEIQDDGRGSTRENASGSAFRRNDENNRAERDRSNLRHRYTSFESVQQSMNAQDRFIDQNLRNHSEMMFVSDRNHLEMVGIIDSTLRTIADVARELISKF